LEKADKIIQYTQKVDPKSVVTISDIQEKEFDGLELTSEELQALQKFRKHRVKKLEKKQHQEEAFHDRYEYFRALSNLVDYRDYLNQKV
jgi:hypothetical protein